MHRFEVWAIDEWQIEGAFPLATLWTIDGAMAEAKCRSHTRGPCVVMDQERAALVVRGVAVDGEWFWARDCGLCQGKGALICVRCGGGGWKP